ncbi:MAG: hypothetical protein ACXACP_00510 [Candidatus Hodarchaeales archaeon]
MESRLKLSFLKKIGYLLIIVLLLSNNVLSISSSSIQQGSLLENEDEEEEDDDEDGIPDKVEEANEREIEIELHEFEANIESEREYGEEKDDIDIEIRLKEEDGLEIQYEYSTEINSVESELHFKIYFLSLIEYQDSNNDSIYNSLIDTLLQVEEFSDFHPIEYNKIPIDSNADKHVLTVKTTNNYFLFRFILVEEFFNITNSIITPSEMKIDVSITNFPFQENDSRIALKVKLESETDYDESDETEDENENRTIDESEVKTAMNNFTGFFSWSELVEVDGTNFNVTVNPLEEDIEDEENQILHLNYPQGISIIHDPKIGIAGITLNIDQIPTDIISELLNLLQIPKEGYLISVILFTLVMALVIVIYRRKQNY